jgi:hypothetical protein
MVVPYQVSDGKGGTSTSTITITVTYRKLGPSILAGFAITVEV